MLEASRGHMNVASLLLERGACIRTTSPTGATALHKAAYQGHEEVVALLLAGGADALANNSEGSMSLLLASRIDRPGMVEMLLQHSGAQGLNEGTIHGQTAFWVACSRGNTRVASVLLLAGADHTIAAINGQTARQRAQGRGHTACVSLIGWWEGELERRYVLHRARYYSEQHSILEPLFAPVVATAPIPALLKQRMSIPGVEIVDPSEQHKEGSSKRKAEEEGGEGPSEEKDATLKYVIQDLAPELYTELSEAFHN